MKYLNYFREKKDLETQLHLLAAFLPETENYLQFQKIYMEIGNIMLRIKKLDQNVLHDKNFYFKPEFTTLKSSMNEEYCNIETYETALTKRYTSLSMV